MNAKPDGMIVTKEECMLLAASVGMKSLYGWFSDNKEASENEIYQKLFEMVKDNVFEISDGRLIADEYLRQAFLVMKESSCILTVYAKSGYQRSLCFYLSSDHAVCLKESSLSEGKLHISLLEREQLWEMIEEECEFPANHFPAEIMEELDIREETSICFREIDELNKAEEILFIIDLIDLKMRKTRMRLLLVEDELYPRLILQSREWQETSYYSRKRLEEWIFRIGEEI